MRNEHLNYQRTIDNTLLIVNRFRWHELNAQLTENALVLPETVGFKAEAVDEDLLKCIQFVCLRSSSFGYKDTIECVL